MRTSQSAIHHMDVGAEVIGIDSKTIITESMKEELYCAWKKFGILVFYDVDTIERHIEISEVFGKLAPHPIPELRSLENPLLLQIGGELRAPAYVFDDKDIRIERIAWHRDTAFTPDIAKGSMLRMVTAPRKNGETLFADTAMAYDALSPTMKKRLVGLEYKASLRTGPMEQHRPGCFWKTVRASSTSTTRSTTFTRPIKAFKGVMPPSFLLGMAFCEKFEGFEKFECPGGLKSEVQHFPEGNVLRWERTTSI